MKEFKKIELSCLEELPSVVLPDKYKFIGDDICTYELDYWLSCEVEHPCQYRDEIVDCIKLLWIAGRKALAVSYLKEANEVLSEDWIEYSDEIERYGLTDEEEE